MIWLLSDYKKQLKHQKVRCQSIIRQLAMIEYYEKHQGENLEDLMHNCSSYWMASQAYTLRWIRFIYWTSLIASFSGIEYDTALYRRD